MATTRFIDIKIRTAGSAAKAKKLDTVMKALGKQIDKVTASVLKLGSALAKTNNKILQTAKQLKKLNSITSSSTKRSLELNTASAKLARTLDDQKGEARELVRALKSAKRESKALTRSFDGLDKQTRSLGRTTERTTILTTGFSRVAVGVISAIAVTSITRYSDAFTSLQNQLRQTTTSTEGLTERTEDILALANRTRSSVTAVGESFTQLTLATESLNLTDERRLRLTETIAKSFTLSGKTQAQATESTRQLNQAFSSGVLRGQEYNTIIENAPEIFKALQRSTGKTAGELRKLADTGKLSSAVLIRALDEAADIIDKKFAASIATFAQDMEVANNNMIAFVGSSTAVKNVVGGAGAAIVSVSENLETLTDFIILGAVAFAARMIPAVTAYTTSIVTNTIAQATATKATTGFSAAMGIQAAAATRATIAVNVLSIAARGATAAMALIGGPLGAALLAATAIFLFVDASTDAEESSDKYAESLRKLNTELNNTTKKQRESNAALRASSILDVKKEIAELTSDLADQEQAMITLSQSTRVAGSGLAGAAQQAQALTDRINALKESLFDLESAVPKTDILAGVFETEGTVGGGTLDGKEPPKQKLDGDSAFVTGLKLETEALQNELAARRLIRQGDLSEEEAMLALAADNRLLREENKFQLELEKLGTDEVAKTELRDLFDANQLEKARLFQEELTEITTESTNDRLKLEESYSAQVTAMRFGVASQAVNLLKGLVGDSKVVAIALIGIEKGLAIGQTLINSQVAATRALAVLGPISGPPAAASMIAFGKISAGLIAATGISQAASLGGGGVPSASGGGAGLAQTPGPTPAAQEAIQQKRVVDIRIDENALLTGAMFKEALASVLESDTDIAINITNAQNEASRIGAI